MARERAAGRRAPAADPWSPRSEGAFLLRAVLWLAGRLRGPIAAFGVDFPRFRELLRTRVLLTQRTSGEAAKVWGQAGTALAIVMTFFFGLLTGLVAVLGEEGGPWVLVSLSSAMLMLAILLFQVLAAILVDPTDIQVVAAHPVTDRTVFAVRLAEVSAYVLVFVAAFAAGGMCLAVVALPPLAVLLVYPCLALCAGAVTLGAVTLLFALCLRIVGPTHFQRVALWMQILGGVALFLAFHGASRVHREQWELWLERYSDLRLLFPPVQYAELFTFASGASPTFPLGALLGAVLLPLAALALTFWLASRYFVAGLQGTLGAPAPRSAWPRGLLSRLGARLGGREERAGFDFTLALSRREPQFLRTVLPQLAMFQVMALGSAFGMRRELSFFVPFSAAILFVALPNVLLQSQGTATPEARVLFTTAPLESEDALLRGGIRALLLQWIGVPAVALFAVQLWFGGPGLLPRSVLAFELAFAATLVFARLFQVGLPFTRSIRVGETSAANFGMILATSLGMAVVCGLHALL
ncbi:MAG TPA: hypothetical protein VF530_17625, partial [Planctomycetota bacterium]